MLPLIVLLTILSLLFLIHLLLPEEDSLHQKQVEKIVFEPPQTTFKTIECRQIPPIIYRSEDFSDSAISSIRINPEFSVRKIPINKRGLKIEESKDIIRIIYEQGGYYISDKLISHSPLSKLPDDDVIYFFEGKELLFLSGSRGNEKLNNGEGIELERRGNRLYFQNELIFTISEKLIGPPTSEYSLDFAITYRKKEIIASGQRIPYIIVQTNEKEEIPLQMKLAINTILNNNREYDYYYFTSKDRDEFIKTNFGDEIFDIYDSLIPGAFRADFFRTAFLYLKGGVYIDSSMVSVTPLREVISHHDELITADDDNATVSRGHPHLYNAFIAVTPKHPIMERYLNKSIENIRNRDYSKTDLGITGPRTFGEAFVELTGIIPEQLKRYSNIKILSRTKKQICDESNVIFFVKYKGYFDDQKKYNGKRYGSLFKSGKVFR